MTEARTFPLQAESSRNARPSPTSIPWSVAEKAYHVYRSRYGSGQSLERLAQRGGFGANEMDDLYPGWREEVSELVRLKALLAEVMESLGPFGDLWLKTAELGTEPWHDLPDDVCLVVHRGVSITKGDFRRAAALLTKLRGEGAT